MLPPPIVVNHDGFLVVRDDLLPGGTKRRVLTEVFKRVAGDELVYPAIPHGYGPLAVALSARDNGKKATLFYNDLPSDEWTDLMKQTEATGAAMIMVPGSDPDRATKAADAYAAGHADAYRLPLGFAMPEFEEELVKIAQALPVTPRQVWVASGTGTLSRTFQKAWPNAEHHAVVVKDFADTGKAVRHVLKREFTDAVVNPPPFPSSAAFDANAWDVMTREGRRDGHTLFWNIGA
jgi:hypothetical protein